MIAATPGGFLPSCTCGWRSLKFVSHHQAQLLADQHEQDARLSRLNRGPRPNAKTSARIFRENSQNPVFTPDERLMWANLADELEDEIASKEASVIDGQMEMF